LFLGRPGFQMRNGDVSRGSRSSAGHIGTDEPLLRLNKSHIGPAAEMLTRAFWDYPVSRYSYPDESDRAKRLPYFFRYILGYGVRYGEAYATSGRLEGVAVWVTSDKYPVTVLRLLRSVPLSVMLRLGSQGGNRMRRFGDYIDSVHKRLAPSRHWFLQMIGVDPKFQGSGYASALLGPMLARIDEEGLPCYLETPDERNVPLYEHFGFTVVDRSTIPETDLANWAMLRPKREAGRA
jgi:ribosomal protein S18 acetylase RimI-like enzyme